MSFRRNNNYSDYFECYILINAFVGQSFLDAYNNRPAGGQRLVDLILFQGRG